uniref:Rho guanine nucleotide exchange factor (GEF) 39 n=1 Tax=Neolamprologus brichardi TaxID=32507 RepID=A0A3Q4I187_NEOBR
QLFTPHPFTPIRNNRVTQMLEDNVPLSLSVSLQFFVDILKAKGTLRSDIREDIFCSIKAILSFLDGSFKLEKQVSTVVKNSFYQLHILYYICNIIYYTEKTVCVSGAVTVVCEVSQHIEDNTRHHENHLELCRVQKLLKGRKMKVLAPGRWFICEGWLKVVPPKGAEAKPKMFFLFSDMLLQVKRCSSLRSTSGQKFTCQCCTVSIFISADRSKSSLCSLTFPRANLLLMSSNQENLNNWYQSLSSAIRKQNSKQTVIYQRDELCRRPLRSAADRHNTANAASRKRNMVGVSLSYQTDF